MIQSTPAVASPSTYTCHIRLTRDSRIAVTSPKTGRTVDCPASCLPMPLRGRLVACAARGGHALPLTTDELKTFAAVALPKPSPAKFYNPTMYRPAPVEPKKRWVISPNGRPQFVTDYSV